MESIRSGQRRWRKHQHSAYANVSTRCPWACHSRRTSSAGLACIVERRLQRGGSQRRKRLRVERRWWNQIPLSPSFETFVEARYNSVSVNNGTFSFVPLTFGIMF